MDGGGRLSGKVQEATTTFIHPEVSILVVVTDRSHVFSLSGAVLGGRLHLQGAAAGRWIHSFPFLAAQIPRVFGVETVPGPTQHPLHSIPTASDRFGGGECVRTATGQSETLPRGLR